MSPYNPGDVASVPGGGDLAAGGAAVVPGGAAAYATVVLPPILVVLLPSDLEASLAYASPGSASLQRLGPDAGRGTPAQGAAVFVEISLARTSESLYGNASHTLLYYLSICRCFGDANSF